MNDEIALAQQNSAKELVGQEIASRVVNGMIVGLGTGSTAAMAIRSLGKRVRSEGLRCTGVATSFDAENLAIENGITLNTLAGAGRIDMAFDGADEVSPRLDLIKGRGGAHTREKIVAAAADQFVVLVDQSKLVETLGTKVPVPVEVLPMAAPTVSEALESLGGQPALRKASQKDGPVVTDQGFWIIDSMFGKIESPGELAIAISTIPGVLDHGLFVGLATEVLVGKADGTVETLKPGA